MDLTENQRRYLRGRAHALKPVIQVGQAGLTEAVVAETRRALEDHELIKLRVRASERDARDELIAALAQQTRSALVARIGHVAVLYRPKPAGGGIVLPAATAEPIKGADAK